MFCFIYLFTYLFIYLFSIFQWVNGCFVIFTELWIESHFDLDSHHKISQKFDYVKLSLRKSFCLLSLSTITFLTNILRCLLNIYLFKVNNRNTRKRWEICSSLPIKALERSQWRRSGVFFVNFENISHLYVVFLLLTLNR